MQIHFYITKNQVINTIPHFVELPLNPLIHKKRQKLYIYNFRLIISMQSTLVRTAIVSYSNEFTIVFLIPFWSGLVPISLYDILIHHIYIWIPKSLTILSIILLQSSCFLNKFQKKSFTYILKIKLLKIYVLGE